MPNQTNIPITFVMTKVTVGNFSDDAIKANQNMNCAAASALLAAVHQINGDKIPDSEPEKKESPQNTVSARTSLDVDTCVKLANRCANKTATAAYKAKRESYTSLKRQYGNLNNMIPQDRALAMTALKDASYCYFKIETRFNLEESVTLKLKKKSKDGSQNVRTSVIRCLTIHKLCKENEWPSEEDLKSYVENQLLNDEKLTWEEKKEKDQTTSSTSEDSTDNSVE